MDARCRPALLSCRVSTSKRRPRGTSSTPRSTSSVRSARAGAGRSARYMEARAYGSKLGRAQLQAMLQDSRPTDSRNRARSRRASTGLPARLRISTRLWPRSSGSEPPSGRHRALRYGDRHRPALHDARRRAGPVEAGQPHGALSGATSRSRATGGRTAGRRGRHADRDLRAVDATWRRMAGWEAAYEAGDHGNRTGIAHVLASCSARRSDAPGTSARRVSDRAGDQRSAAPRWPRPGLP